MSRKVKSIVVLCIRLMFILGILSACGGSNTKSAAAPQNFTFDSATGQFSFTGIDHADYYCIWVFAVDEAGAEAASYVAASQRLTGAGEVSGNVDISSLAYGSYHVKLLTFMNAGEKTPDPVIETITVKGKLSTPEFKYVQDGTTVTITLYSGTLSTYNENEKFTDININIYDTNGNIVTTETITKSDLSVTQMGPFTSYTALKEMTLSEGSYEISLKAAGDDIAEASEESEKLSLVVSSGGTSEGATAGYEESSGMSGMGDDAGGEEAPEDSGNPEGESVEGGAPDGEPNGSGTEGSEES